jgi:hypothetical protein
VSTLVVANARFTGKQSRQVYKVQKIFLPEMFTRLFWQIVRAWNLVDDYRVSTAGRMRSREKADVAESDLD